MSESPGVWLHLRWHLVVLVVALVAVWPMLELEGAFTSDEGSYVTQARAIDAGGWDVGYAFEAADPTGVHLPFHGSTLSQEGTFAFAKHPTWPATLSVSVGVFGESIGLRLPTVLSLVVLAVIGWYLGAALGGRRAAPWAFWIAAASPALASAWVTWAHVPAAAAGGLVVLAVLYARSDARWLVVAAAASALGGALRSESLLWSLAIGAALVLLERTARAVRDGAVVVGAAALALVAETAWSSAIVGDPVPGPAGETGGGLAVRDAGASWLDRASGLRLALLDGSFGSGTARLVALLATAFVVAAVVAIRWRRDSHQAAILLAVGAGLYAVRIAIEPSDPIPGLLVAAPVLLLALAWVPAPEHRWIPAACGLLVIAVGLTTYRDGGSLQWGGRFLSAALAPLAAMAAAGLATSIEARGSRPSRLLLPAVAGLVAVQAIGAIVVPEQVRREAFEVTTAVVAAGPDVLVAQGGHIPRLDLGGWPDRCWMSVPEAAGADGLRSAMRVLGDSGVTTATLVGFEDATIEAAGLNVEADVEGLLVGVVDVPGSDDELTINPLYTCAGSG